MFTQLGLSSLWNDVIAGKFALISDVQIVCDSTTERCLKIFLHYERRYAFFSSKRLPNGVNNEFSIWIRSSHWPSVVSYSSKQPEELVIEQ